jgi:hypothetical protein
MAALARFHTDVTWTGSIKAGSMGPGTPAMTAVGWGKHETIQNGRWIVGTYQQDQFLPDNTFVLTWQLHWVAGWDPTPRRVPGDARGQLRACRRHARVDRGDRLTFETIGDRPVRLRLVWDRSNPAEMTWRNEMSVGGAPWSLVEEYHCRPT